MSTADIDLALRCRNGEAGAFEELYRQYSARLFGLALRMIGSEQEAEDILQEVFIQAYRKMGGFRGESSLGTWLYRLCMNRCLDYLRGRQARMARATDSLDGGQRVEPAAHAAPVPAAIDRLDLERAIAQLSEGCRAAFLLHDVEGFEHQEVARILGISVGTSKSQLHKARMKLRTLL